jgi:hypothetical protein
MTRTKGRRARVTSLVAVALGAMAIFVLPSLASARHSSDDDGSSGSASATIKSFDPATRTLVIALPGDQTISGTVSSRTKIRCEDQSRNRSSDDRVRGREAEPGDDRGGRGNEPGDDNGGDSSGPSNSGSGSGGHDDNGSGANCTTADLVAGAAVEEIELKFRGSGVVYDEVELDD